jgi:hypothetical protein
MKTARLNVLKATELDEGVDLPLGLTTSQERIGQAYN